MNSEEQFQIPEETSIERVLEALLDEEQVLDPKHLYQLSDLKPDDLSRLEAVWTQISVRRRRALMEDLEHLTETDYLLSFEAVFRMAIHDPDDQVRFYAIRAIEAFDTDDLISTFLARLEEDESVDVRAVAASVLGKYVYRGELDKIKDDTQRKIVDCLLKVVKSDQPGRVRRRALEAVSYSPRDEVHQEINRAYQREEPSWRASALFAMGRSFDERYQEKVYAQLRDTAPEVRMEAVRACGELYLEDAQEDLLDLLDDVPRVRRVAIWSLSQIGGEGVHQALKGLLEMEHLPRDEEELIHRALDNLAFTEGSVNYSMFNMPVPEEDNGDLPDEDWVM